MSVSSPPISTGSLINQQLNAHDKQLTVSSLVDDIQELNAAKERKLSELAALDYEAIKEHFKEEYQWWRKEHDY